MRLGVDAGELNIEVEELISTSRSVRRMREEVEEARRQLRQLSQMEECCAALGKQEEALSYLAAGLSNLSVALRQASGLYSAAEERNIDVLEETERPSQDAASVVAYGGLNSTLRRHINQILYK